MKICFFLAGLPGSSYHGGAVTCWAVLREMLACGHDVTILSLYDNTESNSYLKYRKDQEEEIASLNVPIRFIECDQNLYSHYSNLATLFSETQRFEKILPWYKYADQVKKELDNIKPDVIFMYHFEPLAALYFSKYQGAYTFAALGDLLFEPAHYILKEKWEKSHFIKSLYFKIKYQLIRRISVKTMQQISQDVNLVGLFAAHYADWYKYNVRKDSVYLRTPSHDNIGAEWKEARQRLKSEKFKILMMGDLNTTSTSLGISFFIKEAIPLLEKKLGPDNFEIHFVGGGEVADEFEPYLKKDYIHLRGRVYPADNEFLSSDVLVVPTPIPIGVRVRIVTGMAFGCCIIAHEANVSGIPELRDLENCLIANDGQSVADKILAVYNDPELKNKISHNAKDTFNCLFSEKKAANRIVQMIENKAVL